MVFLGFLNRRASFRLPAANFLDAVQRQPRVTRFKRDAVVATG